MHVEKDSKCLFFLNFFIRKSKIIYTMDLVEVNLVFAIWSNGSGFGYQLIFLFVLRLDKKGLLCIVSVRGVNVDPKPLINLPHNLLLPSIIPFYGVQV